MNFQLEHFGLYTVDMKYLDELYSIDREVFFNPNDPNYARKPYLGIVVIVGQYQYFIPLTLAKQRHKNWKLIDKAHFLVYETMPANKVRNTHITRPIPGDAGNCIRILSALDLKKMIPVPVGYYHFIDFKSLSMTKPNYAIR